MRITLAQLAAFFWVARLGSVRAAAAQLHLAQPTVSLRLRDLERAVGRALFEKAGRGLRLTPEGRLVLGHAAAALEEVGAIQALGAAEGPARGTVRIGLQETFALACLAPLLRTLSERHPGLQPDLVVSTSEELERAVGERRLDLAFVSNPTGDARLEVMPLGVQEAVWAAPAGWALPDPVRPADLRTLPILCTPHPSPMHRQVLGWFHAAGLEPLRLGLCSSVTVIAHLVASGAAAAFLPRRMIEADLAARRLQAPLARPAVEASRVAAVYPVAARGLVVGAVLRCAVDVLAGIDFLRPGPEPEPAPAGQAAP